MFFKKVGLYKTVLDVFSFLAPIRIVSSKLVMQDIDLTK